MTKAEIDLGVDVIRYTFEKLPAEERVRIVRELERETLGKRIDELLKKIDRRRKKYPVSNREIAAELEVVRRKIYGPRGN